MHSKFVNETELLSGAAQDKNIINIRSVGSCLRRVALSLKNELFSAFLVFKLSRQCKHKYTRTSPKMSVWLGKRKTRRLSRQGVPKVV